MNESQPITDDWLKKGQQSLWIHGVLERHFFPNFKAVEKYISRLITLPFSQLADDRRRISEINGINGDEDIGLRRDSERLGI